MTSLPMILRLNALSCLGFGAIFSLMPEPVAGLLGQAPGWAVPAVGLGLIGNGLHLLWEAGQHPPRTAWVIWFSTGDLLWWLTTIALIATRTWITAPLGQALALAVAVGVAGLGVAQLFALGQRRFGLTGVDLWRQLGQSWHAMPLWVKLWLTLLNGVFLAALAFWPAPIAVLTLAAYVASGPLLLGMAAAQGGLTRALGITHLLAYTPLFLWLLPRAGLAGAEAIYALALVLALAICLAFDLWDLIRYAKGERTPLGQTGPGAQPVLP
jgi:hypothetical protein